MPFAWNYSILTGSRKLPLKHWSCVGRPIPSSNSLRERLRVRGLSSQLATPRHPLMLFIGKRWVANRTQWISLHPVEWRSLLAITCRNCSFGWKLINLGCNSQLRIWFINNSSRISHIDTPLAFPTLLLPRLAIATILNCKPGSFVVLLGVVCSSWTAVNRGTSRRHVTHPLGTQEYTYVSQANVMVSRFLI